MSLGDVTLQRLPIRAQTIASAWVGINELIAVISWGEGAYFVVTKSLQNKYDALFVFRIGDAEHGSWDVSADVQGGNLEQVLHRMQHRELKQ